MPNSTETRFGDLKPSDRFLLSKAPEHIFMKMKLPDGVVRDWPYPNAVDLFTGCQMNLKPERAVVPLGNKY